MSEHKRSTRRTFRIWMLVNGVLLALITGWLIKPSTEDLPQPSAAPVPTATASSAPVPTKAAVLALPGQRFGISAPDVPWSSAEFDRLTEQAGAAPSMVMFFVKWTENFRVEPVRRSYEQGALPVLSWEPWAGIDKGTSQPDYALAKITAGDFDPYVTRFAESIRDARWPVAIRFAHEMNGHWYPWSERRSGNKKGEYVRAWRHVHDIFQKVGATNVIWIWSPNILRPVPNVSLKALYPGDAYVDWVGMVGYEAREETAEAVFQPTITALRQITRKPLVITETGAPPGSRKARWITDFFRWLTTRPDIVGFIWFEYSEKAGGNADWRFTDTPRSRKAFRDGLRTLQLAPPPAA